MRPVIKSKPNLEMCKRCRHFWPIGGPSCSHGLIPKKKVEYIHSKCKSFYPKPVARRAFSCDIDISHAELESAHVFLEDNCWSCEGCGWQEKNQCICPDCNGEGTIPNENYKLIQQIAKTIVPL